LPALPAAVEEYFGAERLWRAVEGALA